MTGRFFFFFFFLMAWCPRGGPATAAQHACGDEKATEEDLKHLVGAISKETLWPRVSAGGGCRSSSNSDIVLLVFFVFFFHFQG